MVELATHLALLIGDLQLLDLDLDIAVGVHEATVEVRGATSPDHLAGQSTDLVRESISQRGQLGYLFGSLSGEVRAYRPVEALNLLEALPVELREVEGKLVPVGRLRIKCLAACAFKRVQGCLHQVKAFLEEADLGAQSRIVVAVGLLQGEEGLFLFLDEPIKFPVESGDARIVGSEVFLAGVDDEDLLLFVPYAECRLDSSRCGTRHPSP